MNFSSTRGKTIAGRDIFEQTKQCAFYFALDVHVVDIMWHLTHELRTLQCSI